MCSIIRPKIPWVFSWTPCIISINIFIASFFSYQYIKLNCNRFNHKSQMFICSQKNQGLFFKNFQCINDDNQNVVIWMECIIIKHWHCFKLFVIFVTKWVFKFSVFLFTWHVLALHLSNHSPFWTQMVTPILMIVSNIIMEILIQYLVHSLSLFISLRMESDTKFWFGPHFLH
jgi:hypothetical protein